VFNRREGEEGKGEKKEGDEGSNVSGQSTPTREKRGKEKG